MAENDRPSPLQQLEARLREARAREQRDSGAAPASGQGPASGQSGWGVAFRIGTELVAGVAVGGGIGWALDRALDSRPWMMLVFFVLGSAAGMLTAYRSLQRMGGPPK